MPNSKSKIVNYSTLRLTFSGTGELLLKQKQVLSIYNCFTHLYNHGYLPCLFYAFKYNISFSKTLYFYLIAKWKKVAKNTNQLFCLIKIILSGIKFCCLVPCRLPSLFCCLLSEDSKEFRKSNLIKWLKTKDS